MPSSVQRFFAATLLSCALVSPSIILRAQDSSQTVTRPRRATTSEWPTPTPDDAAVTEPAAEPVRLKDEPVIRVGLAADARSVTVSTTGRLLNATETGAQPAPFEVARVRVEPRSLPPLAAPTPGARGAANGVETAAASADKSRPGGDSSAKMG